MTNRNTLVRSMHDLGGAAWFGGSLMGAVGVNGASRDVADPADRARVASAGWARWSPVAASSIGLHLLGGLGLLVANRGRVAGQRGAMANTVAKSVLTGAALAATAYSGALGAKVASNGRVEAEAGTEPSAATPDDVAAAQQRLRVVQWIIPALTGALVVLGSLQGEQQRPSQLIRGVAGRLVGH